MKLNPLQSYFEAKKLSLCLVCLQSQHGKDCGAPRCEICLGAHNSLLHREIKSQLNKISSVSSSQDTAQQKPTSSLHSSIMVPNSMNFLTTAMFYVEDKEGNFKEYRAVLDSGSQLNLITEELAKDLKLKIQKNWNWVV